MNDFKQQIHDDFPVVFANDKEFGRICSWDGRPLRIVEDVNAGKEEYAVQGVDKQAMKIICSKADMPVPPNIEEDINIDGEIWYCDFIVPKFALWEITLVRRV